jgi:alpha-D-xyloside xylohydrolase
VDGLPFRSDRTGGLIDATNPRARKWFWEHARDNILSHGFDYPWLDETEPDLVPDGFFYSIGSGDRYHNLFPLLHVEGVADGMRAWKPNKRVLILSAPPISVRSAPAHCSGRRTSADVGSAGASGADRA